MKCTACVTEYVVAVQNPNNAGELPEPRDAVTVLPSWQETVLGPGVKATACVPLPTCLEHIQIERKSALDVSGAVMLGNGGM